MATALPSLPSDPSLRSGTGACFAFPHDFDQADGASDDVPGMRAAEAAAVPLIDRLDAHAVASQLENIVRPSRAGRRDRRAAGLASRDELAKSPSLPSDECLLRLAVNRGGHLNDIAGAENLRRSGRVKTREEVADVH